LIWIKKACGISAVVLRTKQADQGGGKRRVVTSAAAMWARARASGRVASSVWAISRPLPGKHFLKEWDFSRGVVTQDGDHFLFADFVVAVAAFVDSLDDRFELFLRDHGLFFFWIWMGPRRSGNGAMFLLFEKLFVELF
jgi:hypothetical protein